MLKVEIIKLLHSYITLLRKEGVAVNKAYLFGSGLSDSISADSDIDLLIVTDIENDDEQTGKIWYLTKKISTRIEPYLVGKNRFYSDNESPLIDLVKQSGIEILA